MKCRFLNLASILVLGILSLENVVKSEPSCDDSAKFQYETGRSYVYQVELASYSAEKSDYEKSRVDSSTRQSGGRILTEGKAVLTALENCEYVLTLNNFLSDVSGKDVPDTTWSASRSVPRSSMKFTFKNGEISNLHKEEMSQPWTTNMIRAILTMMQNKALTNTDGEPLEKENTMWGECLTKHKIPSEGIYTKRTERHRCTSPTFSAAIAEGIPYFAPPYAETYGLSDRSYTLRCTEHVKNGLISTANCSESIHTFWNPNRHSEAKMQLEQSSKDPQEVSGVSAEEISKLTIPTTILYDSKRNIPDGDWELTITQNVVRMISTMYDNLEVNKADIYLQLKEKLRFIGDLEKLEKTLLQDDVDPLRAQFKKNILRDIAAEIGTEAAVTYLANLIDQNQLDIGGTLAFYMRLHMSHEPTVKGLEALAINLENAWSKFENSGALGVFKFDQKKLIRRMLLGVSGYAHQFCRSSPNCGAVPAYERVINVITLFTSSQQPEVAPAALHALGNVEKLTEKAVTAIKTLLSSSSLLGNVKRITAFEAFRRDPCQPDLKATARKLLEGDLGLEYKIEAFLALSRCLEEDDLKAIDRVLMDPASPLSSFIASYVHNIMDSQSPSKNFLKESLLSQIGIPQEIHTVHNMSQSSKFVEFSTFDPIKNLGFSTDGHIIFNKGNLNPEFTRFNVTVDVYGRSYNVFEIGASARLFPSSHIEKFIFGKSDKHILKRILPALFSLDTYFRVFGTTVSMGLDLPDTFSGHQFLERNDDAETGLMRMVLTQPFSTMEKAITYPTVSGSPITFSLQGLYFPMISVNHTGNPNGVSLRDLFSRWDQESASFKHISSSDSAFIVKLETSTGKGTPLQMGDTYEGKVHFNHTIGYESVKNIASMKWEKKIVFPEDIIWSQRFTNDRIFYMEMNGENKGQWSVYWDTSFEGQDQLFEVEAVGLRFSGKNLRKTTEQYSGNLRGDFMLMVEKTESAFTGYNLEVLIEKPETKRTVMNAKLTANGLANIEAIDFNVDWNDVSVYDLENDADRPKLTLVAKADLIRHGLTSGAKFTYSSVGRPKSELNLMSRVTELENCGILRAPCRENYDMKLETSVNGQQYNLMEWKIVNTKTDGQVSIELGPTGNQLVTYKFHVTNPVDPQQTNEVVPNSDPHLPWKTMNMEVNHESGFLGKLRLAMDSTAENRMISSNLTLQIRDDKYEIKQTIPKLVRIQPAGESYPKKKVCEMVFKLEYMDSFQNDATLTINKLRNHVETDETHRNSFKNVSIHLVSNKMSSPVVLEYTRILEFDTAMPHRGLKSMLISSHIDAFGAKRMELSHGDNLQMNNDQTDKCIGRSILISTDEDKSPYKAICITRVASTNFAIFDLFEYTSSYNDTGPSVIFKAGGYHFSSMIGGNLTSETSFENSMNVIHHATRLGLNFDKEHIRWKTVSNTTLNKDAMTLAIKSETSQEMSGRTIAWNTYIDGTLAPNPLYGQSKLKFDHKGPGQILIVDLTNDAHTTISAFNNTLTALIDSRGRARIASPKKLFTLFYSADRNIPEEDRSKYGFNLKTAVDMKYEILTDPQPQQVFHYTDNFHVGQLIGQENWNGDGQGNLAIQGQEMMGYDYFGTLHLGVVPTDIDDELKYNSGRVIPSQRSKVDLNFKLNGWISQGTPGLEQGHPHRNHTISESCSMSFIPGETRLDEDFDVHYRMIEVATGKASTTVDMKATKHFLFRNLLNFYNRQKIHMVIDNSTIVNQDVDIEVRGSYVKVLVDSNDEKAGKKFLIDFSGGVFEQKHQHKLNVQSRSDFHGMSDSGLKKPSKDFNITISRR